jgi:hypothetical protein
MGRCHLPPQRETKEGTELATALPERAEETQEDLCCRNSGMLQADLLKTAPYFVVQIVVGD